jgi:hypothetical protein
MEIVLGVSMTPTTVRLVLAEGEKADGVIVDHDVFDVGAVNDSATSSATDDVIAAVLGTHEGATASGHHLLSTGVTWTDRAEAAALHDALIARGIEGVLLVSELHAAAALAQAVGRAVGYDKTALMFIERETATLAVVETADSSVVKVLSQSLHDGDAVAVVAEMAAGVVVDESVAQCLLVVGSGIDVTAVKALLTDLVDVPVAAPEQPQLALARGAALASANAPRYDASTIGLAYSQDLDGTTAQTISVADGASPNAADIASDPDGTTARTKPFLLVGSALTAVFVAGMTALAITMVVNIEPTADRTPDVSPVQPSAAAPPAMQPALPAPQRLPQPVPAPGPAVPPLAREATAQLKDLPAPPPPPRVVVRNVAPAPAASPPPAPVAPPPPLVPPALPPPVIAPPIIQWLPPILQPPTYYNPRIQSPPYYPSPRGSWPGNGGSGHGHGHGRGD